MCGEPDEVLTKRSVFRRPVIWSRGRPFFVGEDFIEIPVERVEETWKQVTRAYAKRAAIPGFRKGHAPETVVVKRFADEIKGDVLDHVLPEALSEAVEERKLAVLGRPRIEALTWDPPGPIWGAPTLAIWEMYVVKP